MNSKVFFVGFVIVWQALLGLASLYRPHFELDILDVGQGDAIFISAFGKNYLVDTGPDNYISYYVFKKLSSKPCRLDQVIITHAHEDHDGGLDKLQKLCQIYSAKINDVYLADARAQGISELIRNKFENNNFYVYQIVPENFSILENTSDLNFSSKILLVKYNGFEALLLGDAPVEVLQEINWQKVAELVEEGLDIVKVSHHGSRTGLYTPLFKVMKPKVCVISVGENTYGLPDEDSIGYFTQSGCKLLRTDIDGSIEVKLD